MGNCSGQQQRHSDDFRRVKPAVECYRAQSEEAQYQIRRMVCKWYRYVSQVVRMFDVELHKECTYCSFLINLLEVEDALMEDIEKPLSLEMYKPEKTFEGDGSGEYTPAEPKNSAGKPEENDPLDEIIKRINEQYQGAFTDADKVMLGALRDKLRADEKLHGIAGDVYLPV